MSCSGGHRLGLDLVLLWLWCRLAAAAPIRPPSLGTSICHRCCLAPVSELVDVSSGHSRDEQARGHDGDPGENFEPHRDAVTKDKPFFPAPQR